MKECRSYYATNVSALSFAECTRFGGGFLKGCLTYLLTRKAQPEGKKLMPDDYDAIEATFDDLSLDFRPVIRELNRPYEAIGFRVIGYQRLEGSKHASLVDSGSSILLSADGTYVGIIACLINADPNNETKPQRTQVQSVHAYNSSGQCICISNLEKRMDPRPGNVSVFIQTQDISRMLERAKKEVTKRTWEIRRFSDWREVRAALEEDDYQNFLHRRDKRGMFVPVG